MEYLTSFMVALLVVRIVKLAQHSLPIAHHAELTFKLIKGNAFLPVHMAQIAQCAVALNVKLAKLDGT
jgi:hypothetical protein